LHPLPDLGQMAHQADRDGGGGAATNNNN